MSGRLLIPFSFFLFGAMLFSRPSAAATCGATRKDDKNSTVAEFKLSGSVAAGSEFECEFDPGLIFQLTPEGDGWRVVVHGANAGENLAVSPAAATSAPFISGADIPQAEWKSQDLERRFLLLQAPKPGETEKSGQPEKATPKRIEGGRGSLKITGITWKGEHDMAAMSFDMSLQLTVLVAEGVPYFLLTHEFKSPKMIASPPPKYTAEAKKARLEGAVALALTVDPQGNAQDISVVTPLGMGLDQSAIEVMKASKFQPATIDGHPVAHQLKIKVLFHLPMAE